MRTALVQKRATLTSGVEAEFWQKYQNLSKELLPVTATMIRASSSAWIGALQYPLEDELNPAALQVKVMRTALPATRVAELQKTVSDRREEFRKLSSELGRRLLAIHTKDKIQEAVDEEPRGGKEAQPTRRLAR